jgi:hypothetical protein
MYGIPSWDVFLLYWKFLEGVGKMSKRGGILKKILIVLLIVILLPVGFIFLRFGSALTQEGNPVPYLRSIMKLELSNNGKEKVVDGQHEERYISEFKVKYPYGIAIEYMESLGWKFKEQMGSGFIFEKNEQQAVVETRQYSKQYYIWDVPKEVIYDQIEDGTFSSK